MMRRCLGMAAALCAILIGPVLADPTPAPAEGMQASFPKCNWAEVKGRDLSIWSFVCGADSGNLRLVPDDGLPGFVLKSGSDEKGSVAIRVFKKSATASVASVLPQVRAASPGRYTARCALVPTPDPKGNKAKSYTFEPTGAEAKAWAKSQTTSAMPDKPCGPLGTAYVGDRIFLEMTDDPTRVAFIDMGSEIQPFDPSTLRSISRR